MVRVANNNDYGNQCYSVVCGTAALKVKKIPTMEDRETLRLNWLTDWLTDRLTNSMIVWLTDWLTGLLTNLLTDLLSD